MAGSLGRRALAELIGIALLVAAVVGSGIAASRLSPNDVGLELFENAVATGAALVAIILAVGPVSGAHLNPIITLIDRVFRGVSTVDAAVYIVAQVVGAIAGAVLANLMFSLPALEVSTKVRTGGGLWLGEVVATFGLAVVVFGVVRSGRSGLAPFAVGAYITGAYFFTSSTSFANPAVAIGRMFTNTFAGIAPTSAGPFVAFEFVGAAIAAVVIWILYPDAATVAPAVVVPHEDGDHHRTAPDSAGRPTATSHGR
jgi:glycerol uptake facilitator-like aquaporin